MSLQVKMENHTTDRFPQLHWLSGKQNYWTFMHQRGSVYHLVRADDELTLFKREKARFGPFHRPMRPSEFNSYFIKPISLVSH